VQRAPAAWRQSGFEWLWRIRQEPQLWTRYAADLRWLAGAVLWQAMPLAVFRAWQSFRRSGPAAQRPPQVEVRLEPARAGKTIRLSGAFTRDTLGLLREALASAIRHPASLTLDIDAVTALDAASLGLILIVHGQLHRRGHGLAIKRPGWRMRLLLGLHGCGFLMRPQQKAPAFAVAAPPGKTLASGGPR
jgi:N-acetylglucosaminyldiphosphoundecaprenol N-acetyl-beta-D-mannosaminyltransferase